MIQLLYFNMSFGKLNRQNEPLKRKTNKYSAENTKKHSKMSKIKLSNCRFESFFMLQFLMPKVYKIFKCNFKTVLNILFRAHTTQNSQNKWTKISSLETNIFELKMMVKSGLDFFILKFYQPLQRYLLTCYKVFCILVSFRLSFIWLKSVFILTFY